ncbi:MAG: alpha/beta hydrolase, partial [Candidatus Wallbacteria bacterium]|nr:alpha/beta hydrolase [Candidatus Wallbacteria bacterium]
MQERIHTIPTEDGTLLHVWDVGEGPPILALHGIPEDHTSYDRLVPLLAGRARLLLPDLRGFGESRRAHLRPPLTPATLAQDAATVLRALELADPILLGHDLGGYAALDALQRQLIRPRALILLNTTYKKVHLTGSPQMALFCLPYIGRRLLRLLGPRLADLAFRRGLADPSKLDAVRVERCRQLCSDPATLESMADLYDGFRKSAFEKLAHPDRRP